MDKRKLPRTPKFCKKCKAPRIKKVGAKQGRRYYRCPYCMELPNRFYYLHKKLTKLKYTWNTKYRPFLLDKPQMAHCRFSPSRLHRELVNNRDTMVLAYDGEDIYFILTGQEPLQGRDISLLEEYRQLKKELGKSEEDYPDPCLEVKLPPKEDVPYNEDAEPFNEFE